MSSRADRDSRSSWGLGNSAAAMHFLSPLPDLSSSGRSLWHGTSWRHVGALEDDVSTVEKFDRGTPRNETDVVVGKGQPIFWSHTDARSSEGRTQRDLGARVWLAQPPGVGAADFGIGVGQSDHRSKPRTQCSKPLQFGNAVAAVPLLSLITIGGVCKHSKQPKVVEADRSRWHQAREGRLS